MNIFRKRPEEFRGEDYEFGKPIESYDKVFSELGARIVVEADGSETLITAENQQYKLREGGVITVRRGKVGYNSREKLLEHYEIVPGPDEVPGVPA